MYEFNALEYLFIEDLNYGLSEYHLSHTQENGYVKAYSIDTQTDSLETKRVFELTFWFII